MTATVEEDVRAAVQKYVDGCVAADANIVRDSFDEHAVMWGYLGPDFVTQSAADFATNVIATINPAGDEYGYEIHSVSVEGDIATATLDETQFLGADFRNFFGLVKRDGVWRIVSKLFTTR